MTIGGLQAGSNGIREQLKQLDQTAQDITRLNQNPQTEPVKAEDTRAASDVSFEQSVVDLQREQLLVQSNGKVIQTADAMLGTLLDTKA